MTYKPYDQRRAYLIPPLADELIPASHLVRLAGEVIGGMGREGLLRKCRVVGGASRCRPEMMVKLSVYGYMDKACSSRMVGESGEGECSCGWPEGKNRISGR